MNSSGDHLASWRLGFRLYIQYIIMTEGRADSAIHEGLKGAEIVHHPFLFLPLWSEKQGPKLLKLEIEVRSINNFNRVTDALSFPQFWNIVPQLDTVQPLSV